MLNPVTNEFNVQFFKVNEDGARQLVGTNIATQVNAWDYDGYNEEPADDGEDPEEFLVPPDEDDPEEPDEPEDSDPEGTLTLSATVSKELLADLKEVQAYNSELVVAINYGDALVREFTTTTDIELHLSSGVKGTPVLEVELVLDVYGSDVTY